MWVLILLQHKRFFTRATIIPPTQCSTIFYLDEQRLIGCLHGLLRCPELSLELGSLGSAFI